MTQGESKVKGGVISPIETEEDREQKSVRPLEFGDFVGQNRLRANLKIFVEASRARSEPIDHTVFYGPPGLGKTTLARIIAGEMGVNFRSTAGPVLSKAGDLAAILTNLEENDVLFVDEIHRLNIAVEEVLYSAMEDFCVDVIIGEGPAARTVKIDIPPFTLIGATTRFGMLSTPLRTRFGILCHLEFYSPEDLHLILMRAASVMGTAIQSDASLQIAQRSRGTPRIALRLLRRVRDFASVISPEKSSIELEETHEALKRLGIDEKGFDESDRAYIAFIRDNYGESPVGIDTIASGLSEEKGSIEDTIEPYLIKNGFVIKTPRGRVLSKKALKYIPKLFS